jgi:hypothetical protein
MPILWKSGYRLGTPNPERDALVGPGVLPQTGGGYDWVPLSACVLNEAEILWPHQGIVSVHPSPKLPEIVGVRWIVSLLTMNETMQGCDLFGIFDG